IRLNAGRPYVGRFEHCSKAWDVFVEQILPPLKEIFPDGPAEWDPVAKSAWIGQLVPSWEKIADRYGARQHARKMMDRVVKKLVDNLRDVNDAMRQVRDAGVPRGEVHLRDLVGLAEGLVRCRPLSRPEEELARYVLLETLRPPGPGG